VIRPIRDRRPIQTFQHFFYGLDALGSTKFETYIMSRKPVLIFILMSHENRD